MNVLRCLCCLLGWHKVERLTSPIECPGGFDPSFPANWYAVEGCQRCKLRWLVRLPNPTL